jgi:hypothetical protein
MRSVIEFHYHGDRHLVEPYALFKILKDPILRAGLRHDGNKFATAQNIRDFRLLELDSPVLTDLAFHPSDLFEPADLCDGATLLCIVDITRAGSG